MDGWTDGWAVVVVVVPRSGRDGIEQIGWFDGGRAKTVSKQEGID